MNTFILCFGADNKMNQLNKIYSKQPAGFGVFKKLMCIYNFHTNFCNP